MKLFIGWGLLLFLLSDTQYAIAKEHVNQYQKTNGEIVNSYYRNNPDRYKINQLPDPDPGPSVNETNLKMKSTNDDMAKFIEDHVSE